MNHSHEYSLEVSSTASVLQKAPNRKKEQRKKTISESCDLPYEQSFLVTLRASGRIRNWHCKLQKKIPRVTAPSAGFHERRSRSQSRKRSRKSAYDLVNIKNRSHKRSHKLDGIGVGRIRTFPFSSDSAYDLVKTRLSESETEAEG